MNIFQFILDYLELKFSSLVAGQRHYSKWKRKNYALRQAELKNQNLSLELEIACQKNQGILTYAQFLGIEQFGQHGYHAKNHDFGRTGTYRHWTNALLTLCKENSYQQVVEFGSGDGSLGIELARKASQKNFSLVWHGVEINEKLKQETINEFKKQRLEKYLGKITSTFAELRIKEPCLIVFSYSLDSIPPEVFINTTKERGAPNTIIGIRVKDSILTEHALTKEELQQKGIAIENGIVRYRSGVQYNLRSWNLYPWQRAYISLEAFSLLRDVVTHCKKKSMFVIIDEFRPSPFVWEINHLSIPKSLYRFQREPKSITAYYQQLGENLLYYPFYFEAFTTLLNSLGFSSIYYDIEQKMARTLHGASWIPFYKTYHTFAFMAKKEQDRIPSSITVAYPGRTIV